MEEQSQIEKGLPSLGMSHAGLENMFKTYRTHRNMGEIDYLFGKCVSKILFFSRKKQGNLIFLGDLWLYN